jgi:RNA recognition motif-containing protein
MSESPRHIEREEEIKGHFSPRDEQRGRSSRSPRRGSPEDRGLTSRGGADVDSKNCVYIAKLSR